MHILDCSLDVQTHSNCRVVTSVQQVNAVFSTDPHMRLQICPQGLAEIIG
jgi:hypothetical protein